MLTACRHARAFGGAGGLVVVVLVSFARQGGQADDGRVVTEPRPSRQGGTTAMGTTAGDDWRASEADGWAGEWCDWVQQQQQVRHRRPERQQRMPQGWQEYL